ncbi:DUF2510 domain-containing protein [Aldersonia sp. NBC_00410]|uniref:DUF3846 domain-containing protein n=1 Tax=Aldersonia sp. NBC_00410 TaxID=2975954 RepID=UPI002258AF40|nr:DUF2510 domain-containing protein [Aldersonia sp. NBC_00410]MCX5046704.1 DUF2510 domain-containing protein [Aldersonia sp. NBC_00410]
MTASPGWYSDPWVQAELRWWDGLQWTSWIHPSPTPAGVTGAPAWGGPGQEVVAATEPNIVVALRLSPDGTATFIELVHDDTFSRELRSQIGCDHADYRHVVLESGNKLTAFFDDEGLLNDLPVNPVAARILGYGAAIHGTVVFVEAAGYFGETASLSDESVRLIRNRMSV